jgi:hypothetical protein
MLSRLIDLQLCYSSECDVKSWLYKEIAKLKSITTKMC